MKFKNINDALNAIRSGKVAPGLHEIEDEQNCPCLRCALKRRALSQDSVDEIERLGRVAMTYHNLNQNAATLCNEPEEEFERLATEAELMGYPAEAAVARAYARCIGEIRPLQLAAVAEVVKLKAAEAPKSSGVPA